MTDINETHDPGVGPDEALQALREREAHLRSILDTVPDAMIVIDSSGVMQSFSATAERLFGWSAQRFVPLSDCARWP